MALFVPLIVGLPIGYFTWATVFDTVDNNVYKITQENQNTGDQVLQKPPISASAATVGTLATVGVLGKFMFTPATRHRLFFAKAPANSNIRAVTLKLGIELLIRSGIVFYGGATGGAIAGRLAAKK